MQFRKSLVSVKFLSAILGPEMAAPILKLWPPGKIALFLQDYLHAHKSPRFTLGGAWITFAIQKLIKV